MSSLTNLQAFLSFGTAEDIRPSQMDPEQVLHYAVKQYYLFGNWKR